MKNLIVLTLLLLNTITVNAQDNFQLAKPLLKYGSIFFTNEATIEMVFAEPNTQIRYTLDGQEPTENALLYSQPVRITKSFTTVKARVFSKTYRPSDVVEVTFIKDGLPIKSVESTTPNQKYKGSGATTLIDNKGGATNMSGKTWLGFQTDTVDIVLHLHKKEKVKKVLVNLLRDYGSWIFLPEKIEIYAFNNKNNIFQIVDNKVFKQDKNIEGPACTPSVFVLKNGIKTDKLKIQLHLVKQIPDWHGGKGNKSWIFVDEVKAY
jgi:Fn3 associated